MRVEKAKTVVISKKTPSNMSLMFTMHQDVVEVRSI